MEPTIIAGKYRLVRQLGKGGMGTVHLAVHLGTRKDVALKLMTASTGLTQSPSSGTDADRLARFQREAIAVGSLDTQHVVRVYDAGVDEQTGSPYMAMERLVGEDVHALLGRLGPLRPRLAFAIAAQACLGLSKAHEAGVVHRDIKPSNLFLTRDEFGDYIVKVLDFGIAKIRSESKLDSDLHTLTETGTIVGSPHYMSPEQAKGLKTLDQRTDVWSLGVVLYKMLCGRTPFDGYDTVGQVIVAVCSENPVSVQQHAPWVHPEAAELLRRALRRDAGLRLQSAQEMLDELRELLPEGHRIAPELLTPLDSEERAKTQPRRSDFPTIVPRKQKGVDLTAETLSSTDAVSSTDAGGEESTDRSATRPRRRWLAVPAIALAVGAVVIGWNRSGPSVPGPVAGASAAPLGAGLPTVALTPSSSVAVAEPSPSASSVPAPVTVKLAILPPSASVDLDGAPAVPTDGRVEIRGTLGSLHKVKLSDHGRSFATTVVVTEAGAVPSKVELPPQGASSSRRSPASGSPASAQSAAPAVDHAASPTPSSRADVDTIFR